MLRKYSRIRFSKGTSLLVPFLLFSIVFLIYLLNTRANLNLVKIKNCYDGDTCTTTKGEKIRLACIDTPELKGPKAKPIKAKESKDFLNNLVANKQISLKRITKDRYGRTVGELFKNGLNIQKMIVEKGHGKIYQKYSHQCKWAK